MAPEISANLTAGRANPAPRRLGDATPPAERERAATEAAIKAKRAVAERKAAAEAQKIVAIWNARRAGGRQTLWFYPATRYHQQVTNAREFFVPR